MVKIIVVSADNKVQCIETKLIDTFQEIQHEYTPEAVEKFNSELILDQCVRQPISPGDIKAYEEPKNRNFDIIVKKFDCCVGYVDGYKMLENGVDEYFIYYSYRPQDGINLLSSAFSKNKSYGNLVIYKRHNNRLVDMTVEDFESLFLHRMENFRPLQAKAVDEIEPELLSGPSVCIVL